MSASNGHAGLLRKTFTLFKDRLRWSNRPATEASSGMTSEGRWLETPARQESTDLAQRNDALGTAETLLRMVSEEARVGLVLVSAEHRYLFANTAYNQMLSLGTQDIVGKRVADVLANVYESQIRPRLDRAFAGERVSYELHRPWLPGSGEERFYAVTYEPRTDAGGVPHVVVVIYDITERRRAEEVNAKLAAVVESSDDAIVGTTLDGDVTSWNRGARRLFGYTADEVIGGPVTVLMPADRMDEERAILERIGAGETVRHFETVRKCKDGRLIDVSVTISPIRDASGRIIGASKIARDVTERKRADLELYESEQKLRLFIEHAPAAIAMFDRDMCYLAASRRWMTDYQLVERDILGRSHYEIFPEIPEHWKAVHRRCLAGATEGCEEEPFKRLDGGINWVRWEALPWRERSGAVGGIIIATEDITARKLAEAALNDSETKYRALLESMTDGAFVAQDYRFVFTNPALPRMLGYAENEFVGLPFDRVVAPEFLELWTRRFSQRVGDGLEPPGHYELRFLTKAGVGVWVELRANRMTFDGRPAVLGIIHDISERRRSEEALRTSQAQLRAALDAGDMGTWVWDVAASRFSRDEATLKLFGSTPQQMGDGTLDALLAKVHPDDRQHVRAAFEGALASERNYAVDYRILQPDQRERWVAARGRIERGASGRAERMIGTIQDITDRKRAEQALMAERTVLRTLIDALPDVVFTKDAQARYVICNTAELKNLGALHEEEVVGKTAFDFYPRELAQRYYADDMRALAGEAVVNQEEPGVDVQGASHWYLTIKVPLRDQAGEIAGLVGISRDITDRRRAEESLQRAQKLEALGTLAGGIAHDFNNLLLAIMGNARLAMGEVATDSPAQESLSEIAKAGARATDLVKRILAFSRPAEPQRQLVDLRPTVEEALKLLRSTLPAMIEIESSFAGAIPLAVADSGQVHQMVMNLVTNAAHAIGDRVGHIALTLDTLTVDADLAQTSPDLREGRYLRLSVSDDGCGMDKSTLERIFDPFFTTKRAGEGTGLGLSVVHGIMRSHGGAIAVYSEPGRGTTFRLYFPAAGGTDAPAADTTLQGVVSGRGERVLYVDDESALVMLVTRLLRRLGYEVSGYTDPTQALQAFVSQPQSFDAVVTDLSMPTLSGFDLARKLRAVRPDIPIVLTSGYLRPEDQETASAIGVRDLILKPDTIEALGEALTRLFR